MLQGDSFARCCGAPKVCHTHLRESYMDKALTWFIKGWILLALLVNVAAVVGFFIGAATLRDGWTRVADTYGPGNVANLVAELLFSFTNIRRNVLARQTAGSSSEVSGTQSAESWLVTPNGFSQAGQEC
jgi:hypothetical protein